MINILEKLLKHGAEEFENMNNDKREVSNNIDSLPTEDVELETEELKEIDPVEVGLMQNLLEIVEMEGLELTTANKEEIEELEHKIEDLEAVVQAKDNKIHELEQASQEIVAQYEREVALKILKKNYTKGQTLIES